MLPLWIYEQLPQLYLFMAAALWLFAHSPLIWLAAALLFVVGTLIWMMRSNYRRTDLVIFPAKRWLQPEWFYEALPFLWLALGLMLLRLPETTPLLALLPCLWGCRCLWARRLHRHHARGLAKQLRRSSTHRRGSRLLR
ncbi:MULTISPECIES: hypothetical protein [Aeromonas]|jgi:hypothetical protein|uniref:Uncharacterized protein n=1 Tax=Aeromonas taiwanensis TaxID=633417 RepID=A0A5F0KDE2_9GAMM|nr:MULTISPECIES: hypothetical protein [Aeromonas]QXB54458.1 hypothetical protein I6L45_18190 [Aeromonas sp. FDAARGOS 1415]TFF78819.1 hypothetical protein DRM93_04980 [Aeromonas taiwanensis]TFF79419.1 hypothetical protein DRM95_06255 [Aeromonas taiwanensis]TFF82571.1 hypothetical protein DRM94_04980 [Aeromonas taiwanensis]